MKFKKFIQLLPLFSCSFVLATAPDNFSSARLPNSLGIQPLQLTQLVSLPASTNEGQRTPPKSHVYQGEFVSISPGGRVTIKQPKYPKYTGLQHIEQPYRTVGPAIFADWGDGYEVVYHNTQVITDEDLLNPEEVEAVVNVAGPFDIIDTEKVMDSPYSSCGRLSMFFPKQSNEEKGAIYHGSAAAIDKNLLITAAHNFLPPVLGDKTNSKKVMADQVSFEHLLINNGLSKKSVQKMHVSTHCYVHPKWTESFDPEFDVALIFLSESMSLTQVELDRLLKLGILPESIKEKVHVVGYPGGYPYMRKTEGDLHAEGVDLSKIIYHTANTLRGSSGSPIISEGKSIIGVHTRGAEEGGLYNRGVRIREDLLPFIDECVRRNQKTLEQDEMDAFKIAEEQRKEKEEQEEKLRKEGEERGRKEGEARGELKAKMDMARELIAMNLLTSDQIAQASKLTLDQIEDLRQTMADEQSKKRDRDDHLEDDRKQKQPLSHERR